MPALLRFDSGELPQPPLARFKSESRQHYVCLHVWKVQRVDPCSIEKLVLLGDQDLQPVG